MTFHFNMMFARLLCIPVPVLHGDRASERATERGGFEMEREMARTASGGGGGGGGGVVHAIKQTFYGSGT